MEARKYKRFDLDRQKPLFFNIGLAISILMVITAFEWKFEVSLPPPADPVVNYLGEEIITPVTEHKIPEPPAPVKKVNILDQVKVAGPDPVPEHLIPVFRPPAMSDPVRSAGYMLEGPGGEDTPYEFIKVERQPKPVGGMEAFYEYLAKNMKYPARALQYRIEGKVLLEFVINKDGSLTDLKVIRGIGFGCDEEALRVIAEAPAWEPGRQRGEPVRVRMKIPLTFKIG